MQRKYTNINSQFMYINGDEIMSRINSISTTSSPTINVKLSASQLDATGEYSYDKTDFHTKISNNLKNLFYTSKVTPNSSLSWTEYVYNVNNTVQYSNTSFNPNHYYDKNSFNLTSTGSITSKKIDTTLFNLYGSGTDMLKIVEIDDITKVGSNLSTISPIEYTNHNTLIKNHTLLYHQGYFRTNAQKAYPIVNNYTYSDVNIPDKYDAITQYDQNGDSKQ